jgi:hypothetical protein
MRFVDNNIRLIIKDKERYKPSPQGQSEEGIYRFKAYLEKSDISIKTLDTNLQYAPLNFTNNTQFQKIQYSVDFSFNVFAEDRDEAMDNYDQLHRLLQTVKPSYTFVNNQYLPNADNIFGLISLKFSGLPKLSKRSDELDIYITNFAYTINKDMGFIEIPYEPKFDELDTAPTTRNNLSGDNNRLLPIAFKIDLSGRVLLSLDESIKSSTAKQKATTQTTTIATNQILSTGDVFAKTGDRKNDVISAINAILGIDNFFKLQVPKQKKIIQNVYSGIKEGYMTKEGKAPAQGVLTEEFYKIVKDTYFELISDIYVIAGK